MANLLAVKEVEKSFHEEMYSGDAPLPPVNVEEVRQKLLSPPWKGGSDRYSDNKVAFHRLIHADGGWGGKYILDYACGFGTWATYYALTGAKKAAGFDIADRAIRRGQARVDAQGLSDRVQLETMDATSLRYPDNAFDIVVGHGVIHHVIKYPNVFEELYRVMKPGTKAYFLENLADFPLWKLHWRMLRRDVPAGDVPLFDIEIREKARMFSNVDVIGDTFLSSVKFLLFRKSQPHPDPISGNIIRITHATDQWMFRQFPALKKWGSFCYIVLTK